AVAAGSRAYPTGPASGASSAPTATVRPATAPRRETTSSIPAAASPTTSTATRSHGYQSAERDSSTYAHTAVSATVPASATRAATKERSRHRIAAPMPTSAPIAGASATV